MLGNGLSDQAACVIFDAHASSVHDRQYPHFANFGFVAPKIASMQGCATIITCGVGSGELSTTWPDAARFIALGYSVGSEL